MSIKYENRKFRCAYCVLFATTIASTVWLYFRFRLVGSFISWCSLSLHRWLLLHLGFIFLTRVPPNEWQHTTPVHTHTHISTAKIRLVSAKWFTNSSGEICICFFVSHSGRFFLSLHFIFRFVCFYWTLERVLYDPFNWLVLHCFAEWNRNGDVIL